MKSLYDSLKDLDNFSVEDKPLPSGEGISFESLTGKAFAEAVLKSEEFRGYIVDSLRNRTLPSAILCRLMDYGWGKPPDRVEHTGKDGQPIETITEVRRIILHASPRELHDDEPVIVKHTTH